MAMTSVDAGGGFLPRRRSTMDRILQGAEIASKIVGAAAQGADIYSKLGPQADYYQSETARNNAQTQNLQAGGQFASDYMRANPGDITGGLARSIPGRPDTELYVPKNIEAVQSSADLHASVIQSQRTKEKESAFNKAVAGMEQLRGNIALQRANDTLRMVQNAKAIVNPYIKNLDQMPASQIGLLDSEVAKIATSGVPAQGEMERISDHTLHSDFSKLVAKFTNVPQGAGSAQFIPLKLRYLDDLEKTAVSFVRNANSRKLDPWKSHLDKSDFENLKANYVDNIGVGSPSLPEAPKALSVEDQQAIDWAKNNSQDPRAQKILQVHGIK